MAKTTKLKITANKRVDFDKSRHEDGEEVGTLEIPEGVDPKRIAQGLLLGHLIIGEKPKAKASESANAKQG